MEDSRSGRVYEALLEGIVHGRLAPGARIVERDVAERLDVSRTPVREAIRRLKTEGLVDASPASRYDRPIVSGLSEEDARDLHDVVIAVETVVARRVAGMPEKERRPVVAEIRRRNDALRALGEREEPPIAGIVDADHAVHAAYIEAGAGERLLALRAAVKPQLDRYSFAYVPRMADVVPAAADEHEAIAAAIEAGDRDAVTRAVMANWENAADRLRRAIEARGAGDTW
ncbi:MAG: GntR family transcriptional regulator [Gemmatimonadota bacterium]|nr:GntR family transcriptional regulator [Gemmatimonadota bacterium]